MKNLLMVNNTVNHTRTILGDLSNRYITSACSRENGITELIMCNICVGKVTLPGNVSVVNIFFRFVRKPDYVSPLRRV